MNKAPILLVDDDRELLEVYRKILMMKGFDVLATDNSADALELVKGKGPSVVISDIIMPKMDGMELLNAIKTVRPETEVIMLTAEGSISGAVDAVRNGAFSYFIKPADIEELIISLRKAEELARVKDENGLLKERIKTLSPEKQLIGTSQVAQELRQKAEVVGSTDSAVMITGESGTGKEVLANLIHKSSKRSGKPFVCVNCGALNENLIESELFGSEKGAYTGAEKQRKGRFETADGGTIFFDEIGELSLNMQVKLLRVLQEKSFERVGGTETIKSDFRLITATNRDLKKAVEERKFRDDLYYRINIIPMEISPLRKRKEDIPLLCETFIEEYAKETNKKMKPLDEEIISYLVHYDWPGNVRELRNIIERLVVLAFDGEASLDDLPEEIRDIQIDQGNNQQNNLRNITKSFEREYIIKVMKKHNGNVAKAAQEMSIARKNLYKKLNEYQIKFR